MSPPGAIGSRQVRRGGPSVGFFQPVEIKAPVGALISMATANQFGRPQRGPCRAGLLVGAVYRLRVANFAAQGTEGTEVFPSIEIIDRLYAPIGQEARFAVPIELTAEDLKLAAAGKFVTRIIYLEDPRNALPTREPVGKQNWFEAGAGQDPMAAARSLGRPVAILRMGGRLPDANPDASFFFGSPPFVACRATVAARPRAGLSPLKKTSVAAPAAPLADDELPGKPLP